MVWNSSMIYSIKSPLHNLTHIERPASELPGVAGVSAKRLAANIGEGAMGPTQTQVLPLSQCSHARNLCIISGYYRFKILSSAVHWFCKSNFANFQICAVETPRLLESKFQGRWKNEWYRKWCFKKNNTRYHNKLSLKHQWVWATMPWKHRTMSSLNSFPVIDQLLVTDQKKCFSLCHTRFL